MVVKIVCCGVMMKESKLKLQSQAQLNLSDGRQVSPQLAEDLQSHKT